MQSGICRRRKRKSCPKKTEPALKPCCRPVALFGGKSASVRRRMPDCRVMPLHAFNHGQTVSFAVFPVAGENIRFLRDAGYDVVERASAEAMTNAVLPATLRHACRFLRKIKKYGDEETFSGCKSTSGFVMRFVCRRMRKGRRVSFRRGCRYGWAYSDRFRCLPVAFKGFYFPKRTATEQDNAPFLTGALVLSAFCRFFICRSRTSLLIPIFP